ncbi:MAG: hypothetical protein P8X94_00170 [Woeseiaceae bacterium]
MQKLPVGLLAAATLAVACGGGGDDFSHTEPESAGALPIDPGNGIAAVRLGYEAAVGSGGIAELGESRVLGSAPENGYAIAQQATSPQDLALDVINLLPFGPVVEQCLGGTGTVTMTGDIASPDTLSSGDYFLIEYDLCDEGQGEVIDGTLELTVTDFSGDLFLGTYRVGMDAVIDNLSIATATDTETADGDAAITLDTMNAPFVSTAVAGSSVTRTSNAGTEVLIDYRSDQTVDGNQNPPPFTMEASGTLDSSELAGAVDYTTQTAFRGYVPGYPGEGVLLVRGAGSEARLVAIDDNNVRVEIDSNADGVVDATFNLTWDEFLSPET